MTIEQVTIPDNGFCFRRDVPGSDGLHRRMCTGTPRVLSKKGLVLFYACLAGTPITFNGASVQVNDVRMEQGRGVEIVEYTTAEGSQRIEELDQILSRGDGVQVTIRM